MFRDPSARRCATLQAKEQSAAEGFAEHFAEAPARRQLSAREIAAWAEEPGGLVKVLEAADPNDRAAVYEAIGINLVYTPTSIENEVATVRAAAELARVAERVGGGRCTRRPRWCFGRSWRWRVDSPRRSGA